MIENADRFRGMSWNAAVASILEMSGEPMMISEIEKELQDGGFEAVARIESVRISTALRRRAKTHGDVARVDRGQWQYITRSEPSD